MFDGGEFVTRRIGSKNILEARPQMDVWREQSCQSAEGKWRQQRNRFAEEPITCFSERNLATVYGLR